MQDCAEDITNAITRCEGRHARLRTVASAVADLLVEETRGTALTEMVCGNLADADVLGKRDFHVENFLLNLFCD